MPLQQQQQFYLFFSSFSGGWDQHKERGVRLQEAVWNMIHNGFSQLTSRIKSQKFHNLG